MVAGDDAASPKAVEQQTPSHRRIAKAWPTDAPPTADLGARSCAVCTAEIHLLMQMRTSKSDRVRVIACQRACGYRPRAGLGPYRLIRRIDVSGCAVQLADAAVHDDAYAAVSSIPHHHPNARRRRVSRGGGARLEPIPARGQREPESPVRAGDRPTATASHDGPWDRPIGAGTYRSGLRARRSRQHAPHDPRVLSGLGGRRAARDHERERRRHHGPPAGHDNTVTNRGRASGSLHYGGPLPAAAAEPSSRARGLGPACRDHSSETQTPASPKPTMSPRPSALVSATNRGWRSTRQPPAL